eukprot:XP_786845.2 PREDICTED: protein boule-like [Strongylocentrotus purpuratus]
MNMSESQSSPTLESAGSSQAPSPVTGAPNAPRYGTIIPNRIFVGGIAFNTSDAELRNFFSAFGHVKEAKIIADRAGVSKGQATQSSGISSRPLVMSKRPRLLQIEQEYPKGEYH